MTGRRSELVGWAEAAPRVVASHVRDLDVLAAAPAGERHARR